MKKYKQEKLNKILQKHMLWIDGEEGGERANLYKADLTGADLSGVNLVSANLAGAFLAKADLTGADLSHANLIDAYLVGANLHNVTLYRANLSAANLAYANLTDAYLYQANLYGADLTDVDLTDVEMSWANLNGARGLREHQNIEEYLEDHEDEIVVEALKKYYDLCNGPNKIDNSDMVIEPDQEILDAVALVLRDFMPPSEYLKWLNSIATKEELG